MHTLRKSFNRTYYRRVFVIKLVMFWKMFKLGLVKLCLRTAYVIDYDTTKQIVGRDYKRQS